jgi:hypothetical protein
MLLNLWRVLCLSAWVIKYGVLLLIGYVVAELWYSIKGWIKSSSSGDSTKQE